MYVTVRKTVLFFFRGSAPCVLATPYGCWENSAPSVRRLSSETSVICYQITRRHSKRTLVIFVPAVQHNFHKTLRYVSHNVRRFKDTPNCGTSLRHVHYSIHCITLTASLSGIAHDCWIILK